jgi:hypothetical protein
MRKSCRFPNGRRSLRHFAGCRAVKSIEFGQPSLTGVPSAATKRSSTHGGENSLVGKAQKNSPWRIAQGLVQFDGK